MPMDDDPSSQAPRLFTIGKVAKAAGVSLQTVRVWERLGHVASTRTSGGQRLFTAAALQQVVTHAAAAKRRRDEERPRPATSTSNLDLASTGMRIRRARLDTGLSQAKAAEAIGISRSFLAAIERGESGVSIQTLARMADVFSIPMSKFAAGGDPTRRVMRVAERPRTVVGGGVTWEELAPPGSHDIEPALLHVPPGQSSGGLIVRPGDDFAFILQGELTFEFGDTGETITLSRGDALIVNGGTPMSWRNDTKDTATCLWVELIASLRRSPE
jgi:transcriptional regulator with XRE-family HTH domain